MVTSPEFLSAATLRAALLADREQALTRLYRQAFPLVRRHVCGHGGTAEDAQDVFHDALVILYEQAVGGQLTLIASASTYLLGIGRNLWRHEQRRRARLPQDALPDDPSALEAEAAPETDETRFAVLDYVEQLGARCKNILLAFYYFQQPLTQIAADHDYRSVRSATVQKFKCLERLRNSVRRAFRSETIDY
ncbi:RNA polymerase sigma factor [Hymenobacter properus]|uniref:Sigma-70 family RNA polymerase sigma factor n=1 Tax=Hymenobacter properus TaxID=2791026 RepID=A0A931BFI0_9BACT|nr:sigma-70 family RNA polymerase sigma factor [Hymenobacter properus]MBF9142944.1 sigma-70 family RNA polymerase sigma factor [Hymenobacter properus]MBR7721751.1 sigma-70 family RNA polymerase sigma factor [Microvirga sp. SRT04]